MPCDSLTIQTLSAALSKAVPAVLLAALAAEGWTASGIVAGTLTARKSSATLTWTAGTGLEVTSGSEARNQTLVGELTRAYSRAGVSWAAQRAGFTVQQTGPNTMTLNRR